MDKIKTVGKILLFPTVLTILPLQTPAANSWYTLVNDGMGFPAVPVISFAELSRPQAHVQLLYSFDNIYHKKINGVTVLRLDGSNGQFLALRSWNQKERWHLFSLNLAHSTYQFSNRKDITALRTSAVIQQNEFACSWAITRGAGLFGISGTYSRAETPFDLAVEQYPKSDNWSMNLFFYDHLPATFGKMLNNRLRLERKSAVIWGSTPLSTNQRLGMAVAASFSDIDWNIRYLNQNNYPALNGDRRLDLPIDWNSKLIDFWLENRRFLARLRLTLFSNQMALNIDNNPPGMMDFTSLGKTSFNRRGAALNMQLNRSIWLMQLGLSRAVYDCDFQINTPVLGLIGDFVPISHAAEGHLSKGFSSGQRVEIQAKFPWLWVNHTMRVDFLHTVYRFWIKGEAHLEFGLYSQPIDYPFEYELYLLNLNWRIERQMGHFTLLYQLQQLLPYGRRLDDSPIHLIKILPHLKYQHRGGLSQEVRVEYVL